MTILAPPPATTTARKADDGSGRGKVRVVAAEAAGPGVCRALAELWRYRELLVSMTLRETRVRYRQSLLGPAWAVVQPLALMVVFSLFLGRFARMPSRGIPYPIFYYAALAPWSFVAAALPTAASSLLANSALINKVYFPREIFPIVGVVVAAADLGFASIGLTGMMVYFHTPLTACLLYLPVLFLGQSWGFQPQNIKAKVWLWYGNADLVVPVQMGQYLAQTIPHSAPGKAVMICGPAVISFFMVTTDIGVLPLWFEREDVRVWVDAQF